MKIFSFAALVLLSIFIAYCASPGACEVEGFSANFPISLKTSEDIKSVWVRTPFDTNDENIKLTKLKGGLLVGKIPLNAPKKMETDNPQQGAGPTGKTTKTVMYSAEIFVDTTGLDDGLLKDLISVGKINDPFTNEYSECICDCKNSELTFTF